MNFIKKYIKYIIYGLLALIGIIFLLSSIFATKNKGEVASDQVTNGYKLITDIDGISFNINKSFTDKATAILEISDGSELIGGNFYVYKDGSEKYMLFDINDLIIVAQKGTNFNFETAQDKESAIEQSNIANIWFQKSYKKAKVEKENGIYIAPVNAQVAFTTDIYNDYCGELATISDGTTEWAIFTGVKGERFDKLEKETQKSIKAISESISLYTKEEIVDNDVYEITLNNLDQIDELSKPIEEITEDNQNIQDIDNIKDVEDKEDIDTSIFKNITVNINNEEKTYLYYLSGIYLGEKIEEDFESDFNPTDISLINPNAFIDIISSEDFQNNISSSLIQENYFVQINSSYIESTSENDKENKKDEIVDEENSIKAEPKELTITASVSEELYQKLKVLKMHNEIKTISTDKYNDILNQLESDLCTSNNVVEENIIEEDDNNKTDEVVIIEEDDSKEDDSKEDDNKKLDNEEKDDNVENDGKLNNVSIFDDTISDSPLLNKTKIIETNEDNKIVEKNKISVSNQKKYRRDRNKAYTSNLYSMLELGEKGIITETDIGTQILTNPIIEVTDLYVGQDAINLIKDYCNSSYSLYNYAEAPEGCTWQAIKYNISYKNCNAYPYINIKLKGLDGTELKYRGITYSPLTYDMMFKSRNSGDWVKECYCYYAIPNGCKDYVIECGTGCIDKPEWGSYMQAAYYYIKLRN